MRCDGYWVDHGTPDANRQVAALIWRRAGKDVEVLLVTSRISGHWLLPKGWPLEGKSLVEAAMQEAFEEAGVRGYSDGIPIGTYSYRKLLTAGRPSTARSTSSRSKRSTFWLVGPNRLSGAVSGIRWVKRLTR